MSYMRRSGVERGLAGDEHEEMYVGEVPLQGSTRSYAWSGNEPIELSAWSAVSSDTGGSGDWRFGLMRELRAFMAFLVSCEAGVAPSPRQRAGCKRRLDALSVALHEPPRRDSGEYETGVLRAALTGGSEGVTLRPREIEALGWRRKGLLPKEIAREMGITLLTARSYIRDAASKLNASGWEAAVRRATELGLL